MFSSNASQVSNDVSYIEDVFSTYLYAGNGSTQTITNGIDLAGEGGLVWIKSRTQPSFPSQHTLFDTIRGTGKQIFSEFTAAQATDNTSLTAFNGTGFTLGTDGTGTVNWSGHTYASWTFRKQPKFFDVVTYTTVSGVMTIPHNLGSVPGCWIIKATNAVSSWGVFHRSIPGEFMRLNGTSAVEPGWSTATSTDITISIGVFSPGTQIVIYLFAHDAGGFGLSGNENVVSCGSFTSILGDEVITLGYEPQWLMYKRANVGGGSWAIADNMRGVPTGSASQLLNANLPNAETAGLNITFSATGFSMNIGSTGDEWIYIAIRRGPMKVPTDGAKVYNAVARSGTGAAATVTGVGFAPDLVIPKPRNNLGSTATFDRLRGALRALTTNSTDAEFNAPNSLTSFNMDGVSVSSDPENLINANTYTYVNWNFRRAPSFFDEVCYTGTGSAATVAHNLGVAPELMIIKRRDTGADWFVYHAAMGNNKYLNLNNGNSATIGAAWNYTSPTASVFSVGSTGPVNASAGTFVAYLFASALGVSKVGSYTGTGTTQAINCGFTTGARFVMIKQTDDSGAWYVWDSARGIVAGNDPYLLMNSTALEVTNTDYIDPSSAGFEISSTAPAAINASGGSYIFLAVA